MHTWVFPVSGYSGRKYWGIFNSEAAISQLCENYKINNNIIRSQTMIEIHNFCSKRGVNVCWTLHLGQEFRKRRDEVLGELGAVVHQDFLFPGTHHLQRQGQLEQRWLRQTSVTRRGRSDPQTFLAPLRPASTGPSDAWRTDANSTSTRMVCSASVRAETQ